MISTGKLEKFSEQHLVDCANLCKGCEGGYAELSLNFIVSNGGFVCLRSEYEYMKSKSECKFSQCEKFGPIISECLVAVDDENLLAATIEKMGPVSSYVDAK